MARYILLTPIYGCPPSCPSGRKLGTGTTISDTIGNALPPNPATGFPGDVVFPSFTNSPSPLNVAPLDAAASAVMHGAPIVTAASVVTGNLTVGGACLDAGN